VPRFPISRFKGSPCWIEKEELSPKVLVLIFFFRPTSILSISPGSTGQSFELYFPNVFIGLRGKSSNWGLDKISDSASSGWG
jgi:hypothetical protein